MHWIYENIHRYLPKEVGELLVYYLWLVLPFTRQLDVYMPQKNRPSSSYLGAQGRSCWGSQKVTDVFKRETASFLRCPLTISVYRHIANVISRRHISESGFKRDYDRGEQAGDQQTAHSSWTAGRIYARGLKEASGFVEARRAGFHAVSRK